MVQAKERERRKGENRERKKRSSKGVIKEEGGNRERKERSKQRSDKGGRGRIRNERKGSAKER